jgi:aryl-alcohol dehydrogenase-like predicted oxidoreductase
LNRGVSKLGLGTVQFGLDYGVTNRRGKVSQADAERIVAQALAAGVGVFDTAAVYGDSESILGSALAGAEARIVTKLPNIRDDAITVPVIDQLRRTFDLSLARLKCTHVYGLLLHNGGNLSKPGAERLVRLLEDFRSGGRCQKIGVSAYDSAEISAAGKALPLDLVQVPANLLDQRLLRTGMLAELHAAGCEIHARSAFLQGLLIGTSAAPAYFDRFGPQLQRVRVTANGAGISVLELALRFLIGRSEIDHVIFGVTSVEELSAILAAARMPADLPAGLENLACDDPALINPSLWPGAT